MFTSSLSFISDEDWLYFPSVQLSLVMTMVILIAFPPMSAGKFEDATLIKLRFYQNQSHIRKKEHVHLYEVMSTCIFLSQYLVPFSFRTNCNYLLLVVLGAMKDFRNHYLLPYNKNYHQYFTKWIIWSAIQYFYI